MNLQNRVEKLEQQHAADRRLRTVRAGGDALDSAARGRGAVGGN